MEPCLPARHCAVCGRPYTKLVKKVTDVVLARPHKYCQPVSMQLELQPIGGVVHKINMRRYVPKPAYFVKLVPCGLPPVI